MRESAIEAYLMDEVKKFGGDCQKHVSPGRAGVVDRVVIPPCGAAIWFVETKAPGGVPAPLQAYERDRLLELGQRYALLDTKAKIDRWVAVVRREIAAAARRQELMQATLGRV